MSVYSNYINLHLNEIAIIEFRENNQSNNHVVASVAVLYETLKMLHKSMGDAIEQHEAKLHQLQRNKDNMN